MKKIMWLIICLMAIVAFTSCNNSDNIKRERSVNFNKYVAFCSFEEDIDSIVDCIKNNRHIFDKYCKITKDNNVDIDVEKEITIVKKEKCTISEIVEKEPSLKYCEYMTMEEIKPIISTYCGKRLCYKSEHNYQGEIKRINYLVIERYIENHVLDELLKIPENEIDEFILASYEAKEMAEDRKQEEQKKEKINKLYNL